MRYFRTLLLALLAAVAYLRFIRPWQLRWGASDDEVARPMPGDDLVPAPTFLATRAVSVQALPEHIYPWIVQIGVTPRAGWYSYDIFDNLAKPSSERIMPEYQNPSPGDLIPMSPDGKQGMYIVEFVRDEWMLWRDAHGYSSWVWGLYPQENGTTRLVTRIRLRYRWFTRYMPVDMLTEFADIIMMRKCLLGIKRRAEQLAQASHRETA